MIAPAALPAARVLRRHHLRRRRPAPAKHTGSLLYLDPPAVGSPVKVDGDLEAFGFDTWDKSTRRALSALGDIQVAAGHAFKVEPPDQALGASDEGLSWWAVLARARVHRAWLRPAPLRLRAARRRPLFVLGSIQYFVEEDTSYLLVHDRRGLAHPGAGRDRVREARRPSGGEHAVPVKEGRAAHFGPRRDLQAARGHRLDRVRARVRRELVRSRGEQDHPANFARDRGREGLRAERVRLRAEARVLDPCCSWRRSVSAWSSGSSITGG